MQDVAPPPSGGLAFWRRRKPAPDDAGPNWAEQLLGDIEDIARDLTKLEINTILKPTISGGKMPRPRHALIDIAQSFCDELTGMGYPYPPDGELFKGSYGTFHGLRERAKDAIAAYERGENGPERGVGERVLDARDLYMLYRIRDLSAQVHELMTFVLQRLQQYGERKAVAPQGDGAAPSPTADALRKNAHNDYTREELQAYYPPYDLTPDELATIRKIWEIGTEEIAMQTVIQLDGDVINRITPYWASHDNVLLQQIHHRGVELSIQYWDTLVRVVRSFFDRFVRK